MTKASIPVTTPGGLARALGHLPHWLAHHFREDSRATLFSAALAVIAAHVGMLGIFVKLSLLIVANLAAQASPVLDGGGPVVVLLSESRWQDRYFETSPLDRCVMAADLAQMLDPAPRMLAVDFDLSPSLRPQDAACQARLDALLDRHAAHLVLLSPFRVDSPRLVAQKRDWMLQRCRAGAAFADGRLDVSLGMVLDSASAPDRMAEVMRHREGATICAALASDAGAHRWLARDEDAAESGSAGVEAEPVAINFAYFRKQANKLTLEDLAAAKLAHWERRDVFFGGDYGAAREDQFRTPIGPLPGMAVHAARFVTLDRPVAELQPLAGFATDIMIAFIFSIGIAYFWRLYARWRLAQTPSHRQLASVVVIGFLGFYLLLVLLFFALGADLFAVGILIAPLLIAISMLVDGFITGPVAAILSQVGHADEAPAPAGDFPAMLLTMVAVGCLLSALHGPLGSAGPSARIAFAALVILAVLCDRLIAVQLTGFLKARRGHGAAHAGHIGHSGHAARSAGAGLAILLLGVACGFGLMHSLALGFSHPATAVFFMLLVCLSVAMLAGLLTPLIHLFTPLRDGLAAGQGSLAPMVQATSMATESAAGSAAGSFTAAPAIMASDPSASHPPQLSHSASASHRPRQRRRALLGRLLDVDPKWPQRWLPRAALVVVLLRKLIFWATLCVALGFLLHS